MKVNEDKRVVGEEPNNGGPPSPLMLTLMEIGFSRSSVEMAFKILGTFQSPSFTAYLRKSPRIPKNPSWIGCCKSEFALQVVKESRASKLLSIGFWRIRIIPPVRMQSSCQAQRKLPSFHLNQVILKKKKVNCPETARKKSAIKCAKLTRLKRAKRRGAVAQRTDS